MRLCDPRRGRVDVGQVGELALVDDGGGRLDVRMAGHPVNRLLPPLLVRRSRNGTQRDGDIVGRRRRQNGEGERRDADVWSDSCWSQRSGPCRDRRPGPWQTVASDSSVIGRHTAMARRRSSAQCMRSHAPAPSPRQARVGGCDCGGVGARGTAVGATKQEQWNCDDWTAHTAHPRLQRYVFAKFLLVIPTRPPHRATVAPLCLDESVLQQNVLLIASL